MAVNSNGNGPRGQIGFCDGSVRPCVNNLGIIMNEAFAGLSPSSLDFLEIRGDQSTPGWKKYNGGGTQGILIGLLLPAVQPDRELEHGLSKAGPYLKPGARVGIKGVSGDPEMMAKLNRLSGGRMATASFSFPDIWR